jgi:hypothetical protein
MLYRIELYDTLADAHADASPAAVLVAEHTRRFNVPDTVRMHAARAGGSLSALAAALLGARNAQGEAVFVLGTSVPAQRTLRVDALTGALRVHEAVPA